MQIETVGQLPGAIRERFGDQVQVNDTYKFNWTGGYHFLLANGFIVSVQFGPCMAGDYHHNWMLNRMAEGLSLHEVIHGDYDFSDSKTAEVVVMKNGDWYDFDTMLPDTNEEYLEVSERCLGEYIPAADVFRLIEKFSGVEVVC